MVTRDQMFVPMLEACPTFMPMWEGFLASDDGGSTVGDYAEGPLYYIALGDLSRHLVQELIEGQTAHFDAVFNVVEAWIVDGDEYVSNAAVVGLLAGLQNVSCHHGVDAERFCLWFRPETRKEWEALHVFSEEVAGEKTPRGSAN
jgi:hypothetical protein